ncbi:hypothetical protein MXB02_17395 [Pseudomonas mosselii]|uniref:hypothetical protein n=1 Tax=Pseudomonas mosselii TaxID=78327 RepID=UPI001FFBC840|nr:hypothetical protein [Pseudomonas mosselii]UPF02352.1 hypothetical protein MXB02_17395 [Pseudomonas mosselii]
MAVLPWQVEVLRFSFLNLVGESGGDFGYATLMSSDPETVSEKRGLGVKSEEGAWLNGNLAVNKQYGRVDVIYSATMQDSPMPNAGPAFEVFEMIKAWRERFSQIDARRFGFGGVLLLPVESVSVGYDLLRQFLPFVDFADDMSDFLLQVNRKRKVDGLLLNNLSKWSCIEVKTLRVSSDGVAEQSSQHAVRLEFDINNADVLGASYKPDVESILASLEASALSLALKGAQ